jgi:CHAT domain-containing protein
MRDLRKDPGVTHGDQRPKQSLIHWFRVGWLVPLLILLMLQDSCVDPQLLFNQAETAFIRGELEKAQDEAKWGESQFRSRNSEWASRFQLLEAKVMLQRGMFNDALQLLSSFRFDPAHPALLVLKLATDSVALVRREDLKQANERLLQARSLCNAAHYASCGEALQAEGIFAAKLGNYTDARKAFLDTHNFAQARNDGYLNASAELNLGWIALQMDKPEDALVWLTEGLSISRAMGAEELAEKCSGNLGWAYFRLGDAERALTLFLDSEKSASRRGSIKSDLGWNSTIGSAYRSIGELDQASQYYRRALYLAGVLHSHEDAVNSLEDLTHLSIDQGKLDDASGYLEQLDHELASTAQRVDLIDATLARGRIAAARGQGQAEELLRTVENDPDSLISMRLDAEYELAKYYEAKGDNLIAKRTYEKAIDTYSSARAKLKSEETGLSFGANASHIYDSYIHLQMREGKTEEALVIADESRAGTLEKGLETSGSNVARRPMLNPRQIAQRANATLLFYWMGQKQSYLWAITQSGIRAVTLPPQKEIEDHVRNYSRRIVELRDPLRAGDKDGEALYTMLVAPVAKQLELGKKAIILADGELSELNFETLLVPDRSSNTLTASVHYLLDDMTLSLAPSLSMLQMPKQVHDRDGKMLLLGDPVSPSKEFPSLPLFGLEMNKIENHFGRDKVTAMAGRSATPTTYLASNPAQFSYIHFVSHAVSSHIVPLDSAIVLSRSGVDENSFKLYARDIIQHPIGAKLVTISACYGNGTRYYAGEGLVGLSWAFLRAGAQRVIGALWEVSDESTPLLMDGLYRGIQEGKPPAVSLREAKLSLLHSRSRFSLPFYWATFQIYERQ